ncbi:hypothetical protein GH714_015575 [Hevea brasiliensis]|uniref:Purple acid phosphatase C-terminal domain-containing protein n=1 Tax=Hevea brasiliensis TaxID=3981 RepID=A0A6A6KPB5_HEVBR|nr:hypothetical protein GH714_015575 [Hevea brasiliensis]
MASIVWFLLLLLNIAKSCQGGSPVIQSRYFYELGSHKATRRFSFVTPPEVGPDVPYTLALWNRISNVRYNITNGQTPPIKDTSAPVYITIGDGGNIEGLANSYSAFREASFGHAILEIKNRTHAHYTWHRNHDNEPIVADSLWLYNRHWYPEEEHSSASNMV